MKSLINTILILILLGSLFGLGAFGLYVPFRHSLVLEQNSVGVNRLIHSGVLNPNAVNDDRIRSVVVQEMDSLSKPLESVVHVACVVGGFVFLAIAILSAVALGVSMLSRPATRV